ncbi:universal stress protein [Bermanella sp. R86510]|uniref:universal stress protein n=1 Tax=unclassified Bermanella TaxID=2627862 RepID=UPI0037CB30BF
MNMITACIDGSAISTSVCDAAAWAGLRLDAPLKLLHVLEKTNIPAREDLSGAIGLGSREHLLDELVQLDEQRGKLALEHGKHMLDDAETRVTSAGVKQVEKLQRHGSLLESLQTVEEDTRIFVMGRLGEGHDINSQALGAHLETVVRGVSTPLLITVGEFTAPKNFMIAYDGSKTAQDALDRFVDSPLLKGLSGYLVMVGGEKEQAQLDHAANTLKQHGHDIEAHLLQGNVVESLEQFKQQHNIELMVMGAFGHSRLRELFVGSNTAKVMSNSNIPLLVLR